MPSRERPNAVLFDNFGGGMFLCDITELVNGKRWEAHPFERADQAIEALDDNAKALITALGSPASPYAPYPAEAIIDEAHERDIPVAILSSHEAAQRLILPNRNDIVIPRTPHQKISPALHRWFKQIV